MFFHLPVASIVDPVMIPIVILLIPIIAILTGHQRKMAEIMHGGQGAVDPRLAHELEAMRCELADLKILLHQQAIAIDNLAPRLSPPSEISRRLENVGS